MQIRTTVVKNIVFSCDVFDLVPVMTVMPCVLMHELQSMPSATFVSTDLCTWRVKRVTLHSWTLAATFYVAPASNSVCSRVGVAEVTLYTLHASKLLQTLFAASATNATADIILLPLSGDYSSVLHDIIDSHDVAVVVGPGLTYL